MALHFILGPVCSGKTTELLRHGHRFSAIQWSILFISPQKQHSLPWRVISSFPIDVSEQLILIDDAHYFENPNEWTILKEWLKQGKQVYISGLDSDAIGNPYRVLLSWIPYADTIYKLTALLPKLNHRFEEGSLSTKNKSLIHSLTLHRSEDASPIELPSADYMPHRITGELSLILGPMFAGKTTELIRQATRYFHAGATILFVNHEWNTRYGTIDICSHDGKRVNLDSSRVYYHRCKLLNDIPKIYELIWDTIDAIFIEEGQFFEDANSIIPKWLQNEKQIYISGLDGDANQQPFGDLCWLIPWANHITKHRALCRHCGDGTEAPFTRRLIQSEQQVDIGTNDKYEAVCRKHL